MEENPKHKEIQDLDFKNLDPQQAELIQKLIKVVACRTLKHLEGLSGDKDKLKSSETLTINQLIESVKKLDPIGLEHIIGIVEVTFDVEDNRQEAYLTSRLYKLKMWWKKTIKDI